MNTTIKRIFLFLFFTAWVATAMVAEAQEACPAVDSALALLQSEADFATMSQEELHARALAIVALGEQGAADAATVIAPYLADERFNTSACSALINLPNESGRDVLRASLDALSGTCLAGAIQALGQSQDEGSREKFSALTASDDAMIAEEAKFALAKLAEQPSPTSPLTPVAESEMPVASTVDINALLKTSLTESAELEQLSQWSQTVAPSAATIGLLLDNRADRGETVPPALDEAIHLLCLRTFEPKEVVDQFAARWPAATSVQKCEYLTCLSFVGDAGLALVEQAAFEKDDAVVDTATRLLGEWLGLNAAPVLLKIAKEHANNKYRVRCARGYLRLVRQMGAAPDEKRVLADAIAPVLVRDEEKQLLADLYEQIENTRTDKLLFDGVSFNGWEGDTEKTFRIEDGAIVAGSATEANPRNEFLCTTERFRDFTLTLECKVVGQGGNAGIQFRSERIPDHFEMIGYQADMTSDGVYWGRLYDEQRRQKFLVETDPAVVEKVWKPNDWNRYKIVCWGPRIKLYVNDVLTADYTEEDASIPRDGVIGLQIHGGPASQSFYRNIRMERYVQKTGE
ncbi:MAG: DUF1080 domain-containing protein [Planctomycetia bacterium]|nr:DUF1080 domain-containing protein [Planctomycetia bacterium]